MVEAGRLADVAVVEADDAMAARGQARAQALVPEDALGADAHDEHQRPPVAAVSS
ncbi:MAG: hypothetical protein HS111_21720 [Kofleriaceae bacterium]|nr:hypothetical protein [Kofleriaceae bacterium]